MNLVLDALVPFVTLHYQVDVFFIVEIKEGHALTNFGG